MSMGAWGKVLLPIVATLWALALGACSPAVDSATRVPIENLVPNVPANEEFGELYPKLRELLSDAAPRTAEAVEFTRRWADAKLADFRVGSCAPIDVLTDKEFSFLFGNLTLGVTFPWMQIFTRDGKRADGAFLWKSASLFASTIFHEFVHAAQRARQSSKFLAHDGNCATARDTLFARMDRWMEGFEALQTGRGTDGRVGRGELALVNLWTSPVLQARDEVEAALMTLQWMSEHPESLNGMTIGAVNNWIYGLEHAYLLKSLSSTKCFSPNEDAYGEEQRIYSTELPAFVEKLKSYEDQTRAFFASHNVQVEPFPFQELTTAAAPTGRRGVLCQEDLGRSPQPRFQVSVRGGRLRTIEIQPIPIDGHVATRNTM